MLHGRPGDDRRSRRSRTRPARSTPATRSASTSPSRTPAPARPSTSRSTTRCPRASTGSLGTGRRAARAARSRGAVGTGGPRLHRRPASPAGASFRSTSRARPTPPTAARSPTPTRTSRPPTTATRHGVRLGRRQLPRRHRHQDARRRHGPGRRHGHVHDRGHEQRARLAGDRRPTSPTTCCRARSTGARTARRLRRSPARVGAEVLDCAFGTLAAGDAADGPRSPARPTPTTAARSTTRPRSTATNEPTHRLGNNSDSGSIDGPLRRHRHRQGRQPGRPGQRRRRDRLRRHGHEQRQRHRHRRPRRDPLPDGITGRLDARDRRHDRRHLRDHRRRGQRGARLRRRHDGRRRQLHGPRPRPRPTRPTAARSTTRPRSRPGNDGRDTRHGVRRRPVPGRHGREDGRQQPDPSGRHGGVHDHGQQRRSRRRHTTSTSRTTSPATSPGRSIRPVPAARSRRQHPDLRLRDARRRGGPIVIHVSGTTDNGDCGLPTPSRSPGNDSRRAGNDDRPTRHVSAGNEPRRRDRQQPTRARRSSSSAPTSPSRRRRDVTPISAGDTAAFSITVTNNGPDTAVNVVLDDTLPAGVNWIVSIVTLNGNAIANPCDAIAGGVLHCDLGDMANGDVVVIHIGGDTDFADCGTLHNTVTIGADNEPAGADGNNTDDADIVVNCPVLGIVKTADHQAPVVIGEPDRLHRHGRQQRRGHGLRRQRQRHARPRLHLVDRVADRRAHLEPRRQLAVGQRRPAARHQLGPCRGLDQRREQRHPVRARPEHGVPHPGREQTVPVDETRPPRRSAARRSASTRPRTTPTATSTPARP